MFKKTLNFFKFKSSTFYFIICECILKLLYFISVVYCMLYCFVSYIGFRWSAVQSTLNSALVSFLCLVSCCQQQWLQAEGTGVSISMSHWHME
jgi:hypothetical protein